MKQIKCELCGSIELIKQEGVYVCQHCGAKYSSEEAKKMMVDGVVEVTGKLKLDSSDKLANLYKIARRAKDDNNAESAAKYYEQILIDDPDSWEATFYVVYFRAMQCRIIEIQSAASSIYNCTDTVLSLIKDNMQEEVEKEAAINEVAIRVIHISTMLYNSAKNHYNGIDIEIKNNYVQEYIDKAFASFNTLYFWGDTLESIFGNEKYACDLAATAWKKGIKFQNEIIGLLIDKKPSKNRIMLYEDKIAQYDPLFREPIKKFYNAIYCGDSGTLRIAGHEIIFNPFGGASEILTTISEIVSVVKTKNAFGLLPPMYTLAITDKNGASKEVGSWSRDKIIAAIEKNRKKLGLPPCVNEVTKQTEIPPKNDVSKKPEPTSIKSETVAIPENGKSWLTTLFLCLFLGLFGIHRFYTKSIVIGIIQLLTLGGCGIWTIIDLILIGTGRYKDGNGNKLVK